MRARVEIVIRDEVGNILSQLAPQQIDLGKQSLHEIEGAVENWKQQALPEIEVSLLNQARAPVYPRDQKTSSPVVTAQDWCGLRQYMESSCFLYKHINLMHKRPAILL